MVVRFSKLNSEVTEAMTGLKDISDSAGVVSEELKNKVNQFETEQHR